MSSQILFEDGTTINNVLKQYIRNRDNQKTGELLCLVNDPSIPDSPAVIGWSKCNKKDRFSNLLANTIALGRAEVQSNIQIPPSILFDLFMFKSRCQRYFKDRPVVIAGVLPVSEEEFWNVHE